MSPSCWHLKLCSLAILSLPARRFSAPASPVISVPSAGPSIGGVSSHTRCYLFVSLKHKSISTHHQSTACEHFWCPASPAVYAAPVPPSTGGLLTWSPSYVSLSSGPRITSIAHLLAPRRRF
ncbi:hypothetical protein C8R44DRAFT_984498 [Mycena epipterygia]|nr:hypothetical protein C8R44DRAFT_984498 [Mycena epipterygia]